MQINESKIPKGTTLQIAWHLISVIQIISKKKKVTYSHETRLAACDQWEP